MEIILAVVVGILALAIGGLYAICWALGEADKLEQEENER